MVNFFFRVVSPTPITYRLVPRTLVRCGVVTLPFLVLVRFCQDEHWLVIVLVLDDLDD